jgi:hypothetical protein
MTLYGLPIDPYTIAAVVTVALIILFIYFPWDKRCDEDCEDCTSLCSDREVNYRYVQGPDGEMHYMPLNHPITSKCLTFSEALRDLKQGKRVQRTGWNGKGMYICYQKGYPDGIKINSNTALATGLPEGTLCKFTPYLMIKSVDNSFTPWLPSQTDILAEDWEVV